MFISPSVEAAIANNPLPFNLHDYQIKAVSNLFAFDRAGIYAEVGCGKTVMSTVLAFAWDKAYGQHCKVIVLPPILQKSWYRWLTSLPTAGRVGMYRGTPKQRKEINLSELDWVIVSSGVFKNDAEHLHQQLQGRKLIGICDEATMLKNTATANHKIFKQFFADSKVMLLTGTPLSNPGDAYAYVKLVSPPIYRSRTQFENIHVAQRDFFNKVVAWHNLDLLRDNLLCGAVRILKQDVLQHLKKVVYTPVFYELSPEHKVLYQRLAEEQLLTFQDGSKIDATSASRLFNCLQQIVANFAHFSGDQSARSTAFDVIDNTLEEIDAANPEGGKLIIFCNYRMTNRAVTQYLEPYNAVACYSEVSPKQQEANVDRFVNDPSCRVLVAQPLSAGYGLNLQGVCSDILFLESPLVPKDFHQGVGRIDREGQQKVPVVRIAVAEGTIQERLHRELLKKDATVNIVQRAYQDLKDAIYGL